MTKKKLIALNQIFERMNKSISTVSIGYRTETAAPIRQKNILTLHKMVQA